MTTHFTSAKQVVDQYMQGVHDPYVRIQTLINDWDWEGAAKQVMSCVRGVFGDMRDGDHNISKKTVAEALKTRFLEEACKRDYDWLTGEAQKLDAWAGVSPEEVGILDLGDQTETRQAMDTMGDRDVEEVWRKVVRRRRQPTEWHAIAQEERWTLYHAVEGWEPEDGPFRAVKVWEESYKAGYLYPPHFQPDPSVDVSDAPVDLSDKEAR